MRPIITVENVSKQYRLGTREAAYDTLRDSIVGALKSPFRRKFKLWKNGDGTIWALKNINLNVQPGEVVGIIGRNGGGKSTLLKILSRIVEPTTGSVKLYGRVGSLLEVGTGFHPELTGRENIYLNGAILGMKRTEISKNFDEIVAFAEVEQFIDTPVKRYSSGMYMRLAFAVAAHLEPEILIVDEVLAVGDATFQKKCLGKMGDVAQHGRTVLFVSHNMAAIGRLCRNALYLEKGKAIAHADARTIISQYMSSAHIETNHKEWQDEASAPGDEYLRILSIDIQNQDHMPLLRLRQNETFIISIVYRVLKSMPNANVGFELKSDDGTIVCWSFDADNSQWAGQGRKAGDYKIECRIPGNLLNEGSYYITLLGGIPFIRLCVREEDVLRISVDPPITGDEAETKIGVRRPGIIAPEFHWSLKRIT